MPKLKEAPVKEVATIHAVRVRALQRGYDGFEIRNEGEVFALPVTKMKPLAKLVRRKGDEEPVLVKTPDGEEYVLPSWVERVSGRTGVTAQAGHQTQFGNKSEGAVQSNESVL